nr:hypothetical protein BaRGS_005278 [Batillaria attramentaria]
MFAVNYNRWMMSRLVLLHAGLGDSGVYTCEVRHGGRHLQYAAVVYVEGGGSQKPGTQGKVSSASTDPEVDPDFGRYGLVAFALALSAAFLLLVALLLVILCPSCVSTFLIGRLSSSKQTEEEKLGKKNAVEGEEDVFHTPPTDGKKEEATKTQDKDDSDTSSSNDSSSDEEEDQEEETTPAKQEDAEKAGDARKSGSMTSGPTLSTGSDGGLMIKVPLETNMDDV